MPGRSSFGSTVPRTSIRAGKLTTAPCRANPRSSGFWIRHSRTLPSSSSMRIRPGERDWTVPATSTRSTMRTVRWAKATGRAAEMMSAARPMQTATVVGRCRRGAGRPGMRHSFEVRGEEHQEMSHENVSIVSPARDLGAFLEHQSVARNLTSPSRRVKPVWSRYSHKGTAYLRVVPRTSRI